MQGQGLNRYREQLRNHETVQGHNPGRLNLDGWRDVKKAELKRLYRRGKVSVQLALRFNATMGDHVAMLEAIVLPIDQLYVTPEVAVISFSRGPNVGSDHFPMFARLRVDPEQAGKLNKRLVPMPEKLDAEIKQRMTRHSKRLGQVMDDVENEETEDRTET
ncbi:hypothetical protein LCGC14_2791810 [marine sediment metagenome]|uniref:Endonuclease/exonuclease/phosphatase domain-containing protein n=1 Tax=marine sediment metagenome TaxID=412755 RepID=A0A0F8YQ88_9ZZZZ